MNDHKTEKTVCMVGKQQYKEIGIVPELCEQLEDTLHWLEDIASLGITNDDLYSSIEYVLNKARGEN
ncbi:hypothetical protein GW796_09195 [archaeon]|nr:hypothetical protein [archaeon]NCT58904.1 hypothetical protein [archaeon]